MRVVRNVGYVRRRKRISRGMVAVGLLLILSAVLFTLYPDLIFMAYAGLIVGFLTFNGGMQQLAKWGRKPRNDEALDQALARLNDRYALIHYPEFPGRRPDHVLIGPAGVLVMTTREIGGRIKANGNKWRKVGSPFGFVFGMSGPQLGNPTVENEQQIGTLNAFLQQEQIEAPVRGVIVFVHPDVEIEVEDESVPIIHITDLLDYVRDQADGVLLGTRERDQLIEKLSRGDALERSGASSATAKKKIRAA